MSNLTALQIMERLVSFPTVSDASNLELVDWIEGYLADLGIKAHRMPKEGDPSKHAIFCDLPRRERIRVSKLAALLRVADALDRSHTQRISINRLAIEHGKLLLHVGKTIDTRVEELAMRAKGDLFEQLFGLEVVITGGQ